MRRPGLRNKHTNNCIMKCLNFVFYLRQGGCLRYPTLKITTVFYSILLLGTYCFQSVSAITAMMASFYDNPIIEGEEAMLHCAVLAPPTTEYVVSILRGSTFLIRHDEIQPQPLLDMSLSSDGTTLILKIANINRRDSGVYTCQVLTRSSQGAWRTLSTDRTALDVHYFPDPPKCILRDMPNGVIISNRDPISASCSTNPGNPAVSIQWKKVTDTGYTEILSTPRGMTSTSVFSDLYTVFSTSDNNVQFICTVVSPSFPDPPGSTCNVGPFRARITQAPPVVPAGMPGGGGGEGTTFEVPTSDAPDVRVGANPDLGAPTIIGIVIVLFVVILSATLFVLLRNRAPRVSKQYSDVENIHMTCKETDVSLYKKPSPKLNFSGKFASMMTKQSVKTTVEVTPPPKGKFYPPPPNYPTAINQQQQLNETILTPGSKDAHDVMSVASWSEVIHSPDGVGCDQYGNDGDGLVSPKPVKSFRRRQQLMGKSTNVNSLLYAVADIANKSRSPVVNGNSVDSHHSETPSSIYATIN